MQPEYRRLTNVPHTRRRRRLYSARDHELVRWDDCARTDDPTEVDRPPRIDGEPPDPGRSYRAAPADPPRRGGWLQRTTGLPGPCAADRTCRFSDRPGIRGQALVELALVMPIILLAGLGFIEAGRLVNTKADVDRSTYAVAETAADYPDDERWNAVAGRLLADCDADVHRDAMLATATATCTYHPLIFSGFDGISISSEESAAIRNIADTTPTPSSSTEPSVAP